jgi:hypothetical protein
VTAQTILFAAMIQPKEVAVSNRIQTVRQQELPLVSPTRQWEKALNPVREKIIELVAVLIADWEKGHSEERMHEGGRDD